MRRYVSLFALTALFAAAPLHASTITGKYVEARTCDVWTGPCFANAEFDLTGKNAVELPLETSARFCRRHLVGTLNPALIRTWFLKRRRARERRLWPLAGPVP